MRKFLPQTIVEFVLGASLGILGALGVYAVARIIAVMLATVNAGL